MMDSFWQAYRDSITSGFEFICRIPSSNRFFGASGVTEDRRAEKSNYGPRGYFRTCAVHG